MTKKKQKVEIKGHANHVDSWSAQLKTFKNAYGVSKSKDGYMAAKTTNENVRQLAKWWQKEYWRGGNFWGTHQWDDQFEQIMEETDDADPNELYKNNHWFWHIALRELAIYLESQKSKPSSMDLWIESLEETIDERIGDAHRFIKGASEAASDTIEGIGKAAGVVTDMGDAVWSGLKTVAIVGGSLVGAAIILPPVIRAMRD